MLESDDLFVLAAHLLVALDTPALRHLAALDPSEGGLIDRVWAMPHPGGARNRGPAHADYVDDTEFFRRSA